MTQTQMAPTDLLRVRIQNNIGSNIMVTATSNQIGKTYPMLANLNPDSRSVLRALKQELDPEGLINPGALGDFSS